MTTILHLTYIPEAGDDSMEEYERHCDAMTAWLTEHEGEKISIAVRPPRRGECTGLRRDTGSGPEGADLLRDPDSIGRLTGDAITTEQVQDLLGAAAEAAQS